MSGLLIDTIIPLGATESPFGTIVTREVVTRHLPAVEVRGGAMRVKKFVGLKIAQGGFARRGGNNEQYLFCLQNFRSYICFLFFCGIFVVGNGHSVLPRSEKWIEQINFIANEVEVYT